MELLVLPLQSALTVHTRMSKKTALSQTINSTITASQDVYLSGFSGGFHGRATEQYFFLYVIDASGQNGGNIAVGIDGSDVWGLWIGGFPIYNYVFQTAGTLPQIGA